MRRALPRSAPSEKAIMVGFQDQYRNEAYCDPDIRMNSMIGHSPPRDVRGRGQGAAWPAPWNSLSLSALRLFLSF